MAPHGQQVRRPGSAGGKARESYFDNVKYLTIVLVACGHAWEPLTYGSRAVHAAYLFVYAFHMPAFALVSGYFSRSFDMAPGRIRRLLTGVVVPYVVFEVAYTLFYRWAQDDPGYPISLLDPWYLMWFLVALFVWRMSTPLWLQLRHPVWVALAVGTAVSMWPSAGGDLGLQRVLQFLPFFVVGLVLRPGHFARLRTWPVRWAALPVVATAAVAAYDVAPWFDSGWFYHRGSVDGRGVPLWTGLIAMPALFVLALVLTACFLAWVPGRRLWCTALGSGTIYAYLLHGFVIKASRFGDWYDRPWLHTPLGALAVTGLAVTGVTLLCTEPVRRVFRPVVEPAMAWAFRPTRRERERERERAAADLPAAAARRPERIT
ncbi:acyltransferase family protein [Streptomyces sp. SID5785]|uniref:acyltransferase family protein n=1 Tax=Streptomyces sp. SID5785 TaxID=2690309 RepID=UPI001360C9E1|nr:acyltransferase family protein [Streptomyces sp. SID5785]MZD10701.1 acyltransferase family protein [Streptomyces sp. SID5785]